MKRLGLFLTILLWSGTAGATDYCSQAVGCWLFTDTDYNGGAGTTVDDASPNSNTGTFKGAGEPAWNTDDVSFGTSGSAPNSVDFDGSNDYISVGTMGDFGTSLDADYISFSGWFNTSNTSAVMGLFGTFNTGMTSAIVLYINANSPK
jgi:hypothetical protein